MALSKLRDFNPGTDGTFICPVVTLEELGATRAMVTTDDGTCQGYAHTDGRLWPGPLVTRTQAKIDADAAAVTAAAAAATTRATFLASIVSLAQKVKDNTATAAEQRQLIVKLSRAVLGLASDLP